MVDKTVLPSLLEHDGDAMRIRLSNRGMLRAVLQHTVVAKVTLSSFVPSLRRRKVLSSALPVMVRILVRRYQ